MALSGIIAPSHKGAILLVPAKDGVGIHHRKTLGHDKDTTKLWDSSLDLMGSMFLPKGTWGFEFAQQ